MKIVKRLWFRVWPKNTQADSWRDALMSQKALHEDRKNSMTMWTSRAGLY